jgi:hypothetical protein
MALKDRGLKLKKIVLLFFCKKNITFHTKHLHLKE